MGSEKALLESEKGLHTVFRKKPVAAPRRPGGYDRFQPKNLIHPGFPVYTDPHRSGTGREVAIPVTVSGSAGPAVPRVGGGSHKKHQAVVGVPWAWLATVPTQWKQDAVSR